MKVEFKKMSDRQKTIIAVILSLAIALVIAFGIALFVNPNFRESVNPFSDESDNSSSAVSQSVARTESIIDSFNSITNRDILFTTVSLNDIPLYPESWQKKYFSLSERVDDNVGGPQADADGDGLTNRTEYFLGSDPRNEFTRCLVDGVENCDERNDSQNVARNIHPLTGLQLSEPVEFRIARQDLIIIEEAEENFDTASEEGVDFPSLYYLSQTLDLTDELNQVDVIEIEENRESIIAYQNFRIDTLQALADQNLLKEFNSIYSIYESDELNKLGDDYQALIDDMVAFGVPPRYAPMHRANIFSYQKIIELIRHRANGLEQGTIDTEEFRERSRLLATETVWAYIELAEATPES